MPCNGVGFYALCLNTKALALRKGIAKGVYFLSVLQRGKVIGTKRVVVQ
jgi:hypothetical protein